jgi:prepilin-type processing-associated H-X9-DG protein
MDWSASSENTNTTLLTDDRIALLSPYLAKSKGIFRCPADNFLSSAQRPLKWSSRCRSVSADAFLGDAGAASFSSVYKVCLKVSSVAVPGPVDTIAYVDEHPDSINDGAFFAPTQNGQFLDCPATYHNFACGFAFCDGHAEMHRWQGALKKLGASVKYVSISMSGNLTTGVAFDPDLYWLSYHTPRQSGATGTPYH